MKVEVVEFYPAKDRNEKSFYVGSMHVYICDIKMDLKGISVAFKKGRYKISLPYKNGIDEETGKKCRYPIISFTDEEVNKSLNKNVIEECVKYLKENHSEYFDKKFELPISKRRDNERDTARFFGRPPNRDSDYATRNR